MYLYLSTYLYMKDCLDTTGISDERDPERFTHLPGGRKLTETAQKKAVVTVQSWVFFPLRCCLFFFGDVFQWVKRLVLLAFHGLFLGLGIDSEILIVDVVVDDGSSNCPPGKQGVKKKKTDR